MRARNKGTVRSVTGTFTERIGQPVLSAWSASQGEDELRVDASDAAEVRVIGKQGDSIRIDERLRDFQREANLASDALLAVQTRWLILTHRSRGKPSAFSPLASELFELLPSGITPQLRPFAGAPIRSKPERTYDPKRGLREPDAEEQALRARGLCTSDDEHLIALARKSGARVFCTEDTTLWKDVRNRALLAKPRGRIYRTKRHVALLGHHAGCQRPPQRAR